MKKIWFKAKYYGWGWYPSTWQGGLVMAVWILLFAYGEVTFLHRLAANNDPRELFWFIPYTLVIVGTLIYVCYTHGEPPMWRWGSKK